MIAAVGKNRELGKDNKLLWDIPEDLARFRKITSGHPVIMGRKTFESIGRPLPNRANIIISQNSNLKTQIYNLNLKTDDLLVVDSLEEGIEVGKQIETERLSLRSAFAEAMADEGEIFIIGGGQVYSQGIKCADKLYLTVVDAEADADTFFPDYSEFKKVVFEENHEQNGLKYKYFELER